MGGASRPGRPLPAIDLRSFKGYSSGRWEGDALVVETTGFPDGMWLDRSGNPVTDAARISERFRRVNYGTMEIEMTIDDPKTYTKPWVSDKLTFRLQANDKIHEDFCVPSEEESFNQGVRNPAGGVFNK